MNVSVPEVSSKTMAKALKKAKAKHDITALKMIFPGSDRIVLRLLTLVTDQIPSIVSDETLADDIVRESSDAFMDAISQWRAEQTCIPNVLARYTWSAFYRASDLFCWDIEIGDQRIWSFERDGVLAPYVEQISDIRKARDLSVLDKSVYMEELFGHFLTNEEKMMMRFDQFILNATKDLGTSL